MVVGMPNVGKSSLINSLRRKYLKKGTHCLLRRDMTVCHVEFGTGVRCLCIVEIY